MKPRSCEKLITKEEVKALFRYDPEGGIFTYLKGRPHLIGTHAGHLTALGYWRVPIRNTFYMAHRVAWIYMCGSWPKCEIDHIDRCRSNNRFSNLREASESQQKGNNPVFSTNTSGIRGVRQLTANCWQARVWEQTRTVVIGYFKTRNEAVMAYDAVAKRKWGDFYENQLNVPATCDLNPADNFKLE